MKNLKWISNGENHYLKNDEETLVDLIIAPLKKPSFIINQKKYIVSCKGFWNPAYIIHCEEQEIVKITHSLWGGNGRIIFNDGKTYNTNYTNKGGLKLRFLKDENEILTYRIEFVNKKPVLAFSIGTTMIDAEKILILSAIGMIIFSSIFKEMATGSDATTTAMLATIISTI